MAVRAVGRAEVRGWAVVREEAVVRVRDAWVAVAPAAAASVFALLAVRQRLTSAGCPVSRPPAPSVART